MKLENFCVFSFLALFCERKDLYKEIVFYIRLANVAKGRTDRFLPDKPLCLKKKKKARNLFDTEKKGL